MPDHIAAYDVLTKHLANAQYSFVCPSPETQGRVVARRKSSASTSDARNATDFFGWNLPCTQQNLFSIIPEALVDTLLKSSIIKSTADEKYCSTIRVSNFNVPNVSTPDTKSGASPLYYIHSSFPASSDSVFFGPDTYLFMSFLDTVVRRHLPRPPRSIVDVCCGAGAGAIHAARTYPDASTFGLDLNPRALEMGVVNAKAAGSQVIYRESNLFASLPDAVRNPGVDLIVSNPPYIASSSEGDQLPTYADGGAQLGLDLSFDIAEESARLLSDRGLLVIYTGVAIPVASPGTDAFLERLRSVEGLELVEYSILHPDMWSEEIGRGAYADIGRIQAVGAVLRRSGNR